MDVLETHQRYGRYMLFAHYGYGTMGGYGVGLEAVIHHTDDEVVAKNHFHKAVIDYFDVKLFDRTEGKVILSEER